MESQKVKKRLAIGQVSGSHCVTLILDMEVSKNRGTPKWMVYNGKPY